ncbi:MAG: COX15/CtaA family protein [Cytophagales bacterium]|nr:COX15/CtaA family protein [Cytophagales bacterium]
MRNKESKNTRLFRRISLVTLIAVYFLILVGGVVRSTGSGMGCPDWPKCFGSWVPPTQVSQLPSNYKEVYSDKRAKKNERFAKYLTALGFEETAYNILNDKSILEEADFNKHKTWIEYVNRLIGVVIGLLIIATFVRSLYFLKSDKMIPAVALSTLLLVVFQGWIGSIVVSTNLVPWMITIHMFLALLIMALLTLLYHRVTPSSVARVQIPHPKLVNIILVACMLTTLVQIALGTQVREAVDRAADYFAHQSRDQWIGSLGLEFVIHRSFSWLVLVLHLALIYLVRKSGGSYKLVNALIVVILISILSGVIMAYGAIPPAMQPIHLLIGTVGFGLQFLLFLQLTRKEKVLV